MCRQLPEAHADSFCHAPCPGDADNFMDSIKTFFSQSITDILELVPEPRSPTLQQRTNGIRPPRIADPAAQQTPKAQTSEPSSSTSKHGTADSSTEKSLRARRNLPAQHIQTPQPSNDLHDVDLSSPKDDVKRRSQSNPSSPRSPPACSSSHGSPGNMTAPHTVGHRPKGGLFDAVSVGLAAPGFDVR